MSIKEARGARFAVGAVVLGLALNANAWMDKWAPEFKAEPAKMQELTEEAVSNFVYRVRNGDAFCEFGSWKYCEGYRLDLNGDGVEDQMYIIPWMGCGLNASGYDAHFRVSDGAKGWKETVVEGYGIEKADLVQVAGKTYFRHSTFFEAFENSQHNHWVYQVFAFGDDGSIRCANGDFGELFPAVTIYYNDPKFRQIELTPGDQEEIATETQKLIKVK